MYKHLVMTKKKNFMHTSYILSGLQVAVISIQKDLGVHVPSSLSWNDHIDLIVSKANKMLGIIYRTCTTDCDQKTMLILHKSLVWPQLEYASQFWSPSSSGLECVQRCATKFILQYDCRSSKRYRCHSLNAPV